MGLLKSSSNGSVHVACIHKCTSPVHVKYCTSSTTFTCTRAGQKPPGQYGKI